MSAGQARVFNIPASAPFLPALVEALVKTGVEGFPFLPDPLKLAEATLYLPTRRACRLARDAFLDVLETEAAILPRIVAIGDIDEDEIAFAEMATGDLADPALELLPSVAPLERRLLLAELILKWASSRDVRGAGGAPLVANTPAAALNLASDLGRLIDDMATRQVDWKKLDKLVPEEFDKYWQQSLEFLQIAREAWPKILEERELEEAAARRDRLIEAETTRLANSNAPVIAAGSTGSMPATAKLAADRRRRRCAGA
jgi:ATP-dependent helicase/nuclease subunit B